MVLGVMGRGRWAVYTGSNERRGDGSGRERCPLRW